MSAGCLCSLATDCRDVLLPLVTDQLSGQLDDHSSKPDYEACVQLLSTVLDSLDRKDVVSTQHLWTHTSVKGHYTQIIEGVKHPKMIKQNCFKILYRSHSVKPQSKHQGGNGKQREVRWRIRSN